MKKTKYPDWAPKRLVDSLSVRRDASRKMTNTAQNKLVDYILQHSTNIEACSEDQKREHRAKYHDMFVLFPMKEQIEVLEKLLTDTEMKTAWTNLGKVMKDIYGYEQFWHACMDAIAGGRRTNQRSGAEHRKKFQNIKEYASALNKLLEETDEMYSFPITELISDDRIDQLRMKLHVSSDKNIQHTRSHLDSVIPSIQAILYNIAIRAEEISKIEPLVKKPNSDNSSIHYFVRYLSGYLRNQYGKPLHVVVAATAHVVFNDPIINPDYVGKIVASS